MFRAWLSGQMARVTSKPDGDSGVSGSPVPAAGNTIVDVIIESVRVSVETLYMLHREKHKVAEVLSEMHAI